MEFSLDFFDALRRMKARDANTVVVGDAAPQQPAPNPVPAPPRPQTGSGAIGPDGLALIKHFEGCARMRRDGRFEAYPDPGTGGDPWTIGWGATGKGIGPGTIWTQAECDARLERDLIRFARDVTRALGGAATTPQQFDALVSFHYNTGAIAKATLTKLHKAGQFSRAAQEFGKWINAGGKPMNGLVRRRSAEAALYKRS
ncbi:MAG: lysozyme [Novosphingobium sp.]|uniref:lysozyme n=1 Tax=Novosphingobium sp. TaxID=1874826 RepID=UPI0032BBCE1A